MDEKRAGVLIKILRAGEGGEKKRGYSARKEGNREGWRNGGASLGAVSLKSFSFAAASATQREVEQTGNVVACTHGSRGSDSLGLEARPEDGEEEEEEGVGCLAASSPREESGWPAACRLKVSSFAREHSPSSPEWHDSCPSHTLRESGGTRAPRDRTGRASIRSPLSSAAESARPPAECRCWS